MDKEAALREVEALAKRVTDTSASLAEYKSQLEDAVRAAHDLDVSQADLAKAAHRHRNTIATWCSKLSVPPAENP